MTTGNIPLETHARLFPKLHKISHTFDVREEIIDRLQRPCVLALASSVYYTHAQKDSVSSAADTSA